MSTEQGARIAVKSIPRTLRGMLYCHWWIYKGEFEYLLQKYASGFLLVSLLLLAVELWLEVYQRYFGRAAFYLKIAFAVAFIITAIDKYREWRRKRDEFVFLGAIHAVAGALAEVHGEKTLRSVLELCYESFRDKRATVSVTLARREEDRGTLAIVHRVPDRGEKPTRFNIGEGGVGYAYANLSPVYIPSTSLGQGIVWKLTDPAPFAVETIMFVRHSVSQREYSSILSLPVVICGQRFGTLSIDSTRLNAFKKRDFLKAMHFATAVAQVLHDGGEASLPQATKPAKRKKPGLTRR